MKNISDYLEKLGFSPLEARMYLALLRFGPLTIKELSEKVKINRTAAYPHVTTLIEKGVFIEITKNAKSKIQAVEPENLYYLIDNQKDALKALDSQFPSIVQMINRDNLKTATEKKVSVKYYKGRNNLKAIYKESFKAKEIRSYVKILASNDPKKLFTNNLDTYTDAFRFNPKMVMKEIFYNTPLAYTNALELSKNKRYFYKRMPSSIQLSTQDILIYDDTVAIINYEEDIEAIVLSNKYFYKNSKELFDFIWKMLPDPQI